MSSSSHGYDDEYDYVSLSPPTSCVLRFVIQSYTLGPQGWMLPYLSWRWCLFTLSSAWTCSGSRLGCQGIPPFTWHGTLTTHILKLYLLYRWRLRWPLLPRCFPPLHTCLPRREGHAQHSWWNMGHQKLEQTQQTTTSGFGDAIPSIFFEDGSNNGALGGIVLFHRLCTDVGCE